MLKRVSPEFAEFMDKTHKKLVAQGVEITKEEFTKLIPIFFEDSSTKIVIIQFKRKRKRWAEENEIELTIPELSI